MWFANNMKLIKYYPQVEFIQWLQPTCGKFMGVKLGMVTIACLQFYLAMELATFAHDIVFICLELLRSCVV